MAPADIVKFLEKQWDVISAAWPTILLITLLMATGMWWLFSLLYRTRLENCASRVAMLEDRIRHAAGATHQAIDNKPTSTRSSESQKRLADKLRQYSNEHVNVDVVHAHATQFALADTIISIFKMAGWQTSPGTNVALEQYVSRKIKRDFLLPRTVRPERRAVNRTGARSKR
jgi:hypothetical protein